jgi:hypothetical protein
VDGSIHYVAAANVESGGIGHFGCNFSPGNTLKTYVLIGTTKATKF